MKRIILYIAVLSCLVGIAIAGLDLGTDLDIDSNPASISSPPPSFFVLESGDHLILESSVSDSLVLESST